MIGEMRGEDAPAPAVLIGAHYDTRPESPGADDNASGVAALLACAALLKGRKLARTVVFAAFDAEERQDPLGGLIGSTAYVASLGVNPRRHIAAAFIFESVGYASPAGAQKVPFGLKLLFPVQAWKVASSGYCGDFLIGLSKGSGNRLARVLAKRSASSGLQILPLTVPSWMPAPADLLRSDHAPVRRAGIPAVMIGDTANFRNPNYHLSTDVPETLDYRMIAAVSEAVAISVAAFDD